MRRCERPEDFVSAFLRYIRELQPDVPIAALWTLEDRLRREWGGERVYVRQRAAEPRHARVR